MLGNRFLAALMALASLSAAADPADWYVGGGLQFVNSDGERSDDTDVGPFIALGWDFHERFGVELEYNEYEFNVGALGNVDIDGVNLSGRYYFRGLKDTSPYLGLGAGKLGSSSPFGSGDDSHVDLLGGFNVPFGDRWNFRGELRYRFDDDDDAVPRADDFTDWMIKVGVTMAFGPRVEPPPPPPPPKPEPAPPPKPKTTFVLLADEDGAAGEIVIYNDQGSQEVKEPGFAVAVASAQDAPKAPEKLDQAEIEQNFGEALQALPTPPAHFQLYFEFDSTALRSDSKALMPQVIAAVDARRSVDISVVGHSDAAGKPDYNLKLSERRAKAVAEQLIDAGVSPDIIDITSHGENNPAVPTGEDERSPLNRRVEVTIR